MKKHLNAFGAALVAALFCLPAMAQTPSEAAPNTAPATTAAAAPAGAPGAGAKQGMNNRGPHRMRDCGAAADPSTCQAHRDAMQKAREACQDKKGVERRDCMIEQHMKVDCATTRDPQRCSARKAAYESCRGQSGPALRTCMQQKMPAPDCSKSPSPERCAAHLKAREACQDKLGPEHKACLRQQLAPSK